MRTLLVAVLILAGGTACSSSAGSAAGQYTEADIEYKLAAIAGETLTETNIAKYDAALDGAGPVCRESRERIADMVVAGKSEADKQGKSMSLLELLRSLPAAVPTEIRPTPCADIIASLIVLS